MNIIDVSKWQGRIDFQKVKAAGYEGVMIRAYSSNSSGLYKDPWFETNYAGAKAAGLHVGFYGYTYATTVARADVEVQFCLDCIKGKQFDLPGAFDMEYEATILALSTAQRTAIVKHWLDRMELSGYYVMLYASTDFVKNKLGYNELKAYDVWAAQYGSRCTCPLPFGIWQHHGGPITKNGVVTWPGGKVDGVSGYCDLDTAYKDYPTIIKGAGLNGYTKAETAQPAGDGGNAAQDNEPEDEGNQNAAPVVEINKVHTGEMTPGDVAKVVALLESLGVSCELERVEA